MIDHLRNGYMAKELNSFDLAKVITFFLPSNADNYLSKAARNNVVGNIGVDMVGERSM